MKEFIVIAGAVVLGVALYMLLANPANTASMSGTANTVINRAIDHVSELAP